MIDLVLKGAGEKLGPFHFKVLTRSVLRADFDPCGARYFFANVGKREAALFFVLPPFDRDDLWVNEHDLLLWSLLKAEIDNRDAARDVDLRRSQTDTLRGVHGLKHIVDELLQRVVEERDRLCDLLENGIRKFDDFVEHG